MTMVFVVGSALTFAPAAWAQDEPSGEQREERAFVTPSPEQRDLNERAFEAMSYEEYARAASYLEEALSIGELNVSYLNLGRAYQKMGECEKARAALDSVSDAPKVERPSPEFVERKAADYLDELPDECPEAEATSEEQSEQDGEDAAEEVQGPPRWPIGVVAGGGFVMVGGGLALIAANSIRNDARSRAEAAPENGYTQREFVDAREQANALSTAGIAVASVGAIATGVGVYFLVSTRGEDAQPTALTITPSRDGATATLRIRF
ncbi:MAG: hypothetical protein ACQEVA_14760 [Myxococcota bacterium]